MQDHERVARNLQAALEFYGRAQESGHILALPGLAVVSSGIDYPTFNTAVLASPVSREAVELGERLSCAAGHFERVGLRWSCWLCNDLLGASTRLRAERVMSERGFRPLFEPPGMLAERLMPPRHTLPLLEVREVTDPTVRLAFCHVTSVAFEIPFSVSRQIYGAERAWQGEMKGFVGYAGGQPVATAATITVADAVGVYSVATLPAFQRRGFAEAVMRHALDQARQSTGIERTVLQSSSMGYRLYRQMGYRTVTRFSVWLAN